MPEGTPKRVKPPCYIQVADLKDLGRLVCALERVPYPVFSVSSAGSKILTTQVDMFMGTPIFYFINSAASGNFLAYRSTGGVEEVSVTDSPSNPGFAYSPIISVKKLPLSFEKALVTPQKRLEKYQALQVEDLPNIARVCAYKMVFEEPPLPLFQFPHNQNFVIGAFTRIDEYEEASLFFYFLMDSSPSGGFIRYSPSKGSDVGFTNRIDEHGYVYIKIIRLAAPHPIVEV